MDKLSRHHTETCGMCESIDSSALSCRAANELLSCVAKMMTFDCISTDKQQILEETAHKIQTILAFKHVCFYLADEEAASFYPAYSYPDALSSRMKGWVERLIADQTFSRALNCNKVVKVAATDEHPVLVLHSVGTASRTSGMFIGQPQYDGIEDAHLTFLTLLLQACANCIENLELYTMLHKVNRDLEEKVIQLQDNEQELLKHHSHLEELVSERTRELVIAREEAEHSARAKGQFLANMSHEIRTPLNAMIGLTELLLETTLDKQQREYAASVKDSSQNLLVIINDILDFSKIEAGALRLETIPFDLISTIDKVTSILRPQAIEKGLSLTVSIAKDVPHLLKGDPQRLKQVITNLLSNSIKFTAHGSVSVRVEVVPAQRTTTQLKFCIVDTGIGIAEEALPHLFQSFSQVDTSTSRRYGGTGLGLAISKQLVDLMGGEIGVVSSAGKGSCFWFTLPLDEASASIWEDASSCRPIALDQEQSGEAVFDPRVLDGLLGADSDLKGVVLETFADDLENLLNRVINCLSSAQYDAANAALHAVKGLCGNVGAVLFQEYVQRLEPQLSHQDQLRGSRGTIISELKNQQHLILAEIQSYKASLGL